ncbi:uncharacterized protein LOC117104791 [Anneissia japonica]|uniref:uncharacterized protein LOC117104791 n=1 Tax=Anneissia japonica TaxID=1529436 RepID=UPI001425AC61|nr:uncharacterized protein LOC117104791 [Anneissia japonica]
MTCVSKNQVPCTSKTCSWNVYRGAKRMKIIEGKPVSDMQWAKPQWAKPNYYKQGNQQPINTESRKLFNPMKNSRQMPTAQGIVDALFPSCSNSTIWKYLSTTAMNYNPQEDFNVGIEVEVETSHDIAVPKSLQLLAANFQSPENFINNLPTYSHEEIMAIEKVTRGQSENVEWAKYRTGRITASNLKSVVTRNKTLHSNTHLSKDSIPIFKKIMGYTHIDPNLPNLKYGRITEPIARSLYEKILKGKGHVNIEVSECGLFVHPKKIFMGASPDACCGKGLLEIKCSRTIALDQPTEENMEALYVTTNEKLKPNHQYYYQIQAQMGITKRNWCNFFYIYQGGILFAAY